MHKAGTFATPRTYPGKGGQLAKATLSILGVRREGVKLPALVFGSAGSEVKKKTAQATPLQLAMIVGAEQSDCRQIIWQSDKLPFVVEE